MFSRTITVAVQVIYGGTLSGCSLNLRQGESDSAMSTFKRFSAAVCYVFLVCWSWETNASHLLTNTISSGILIDQQFDQNRYVISGFIVDAESAENLVGATVHASEMDIGTTTNRYGFFRPIC